MVKNLCVETSVEKQDCFETHSIPKHPSKEKFLFKKSILSKTSYVNDFCMNKHKSRKIVTLLKSSKGEKIHFRQIYRATGLFKTIFLNNLGILKLGNSLDPSLILID